MRLRPRFSVPDPSHWWWGVCCWLILLATPGRSLQAEPPVAVGGPKTVTVSVVDDRTGQPVSGFTYRIAVVTTDVRRSDEPGAWQDPQSPRGEFPVQVPRSCQLQVTVRARGYCDFWGYEEITEAFVIRSQEDTRESKCESLAVGPSAASCATRKPTRRSPARRSGLRCSPHL